MSFKDTLLGLLIIGISASAFFLNESTSDIQWAGSALVLLGLIINAFGTKLSIKLKNLTWKV